MDIIFDIETMRNGAMLDRLPVPEVKIGNLKDEAKIAEKQKEAMQDQIDKMALSPLYGRICAAVMITEHGDVTRVCIDGDNDVAETEIIEHIFETLACNRVVTYNGNGFDLPFIYRRAVLLGIDIRQFGAPTLAEMTARYNNKHHVDLMQAWCGFGNYEKLDNVAGAMFDDHKIEIDFRNFPELIKTDEGREMLLDYCEQDVRLTGGIWTRVNGILI